MKTGSALVVACLAVAVSSEGFSDDIYDETTGFVTLLKSDGSSGRYGHSLNTAGNWSDGLPPHNDPPTNYYVKTGWYAYADNGELNFPSPLYVAGAIVPRASSSQSATFADLKLLDGGKVYYSLLYNLRGNITILATDADNPAQIVHSRNASDAIKLYAAMSGAEDSQAEFIGSYSTCFPSLKIKAGSDWTAFRGTFRIADNLGLDIQECSLNTSGTLVLGSNTWMYVKAGYPCSFGGLQFGNGSCVTNYATMDVSDVLQTGTNMTWCLLNGASRISTIGTMQIVDGTYMYFTAPSGTPEAFHVTNRFEIGNGVTMQYYVDGATDGTQREFPIFRMTPEAVAAGIPDFTAVNTSMKKVLGSLPVTYVDVRDDAETPGGKVAYLTHRRVIRYCGANHFGSTDDLSVDPDLDQTAMWSDGLFPHPDCDYLLGSQTNIAFRAATAEHPNRVTTFPGGALAMSDLTTIYLYGVDVCISNLHTYGRSIVYQRSGESWLRGNLTLHRQNASNKFVARVYQSYHFHVESDISGDGDMNANNYYPRNNGGTLYLGGMNTNWTGKLVTSWEKDASSPNVSETAHMHVVIGDARSLGGGNATFLHDAVTLKDYTEIRVTNTTAFAEANRGFMVSENGCLNIDDSMTATLRAPVTLDGTLRKTGCGTLALGGKLRFGANDDLEDGTGPTDGRNAILVQSGALKVVGADALDGAALTFSEGASLHLDARSDDAGMQTGGFVFTNALSSITGGGTLPVVFDGGTPEDVATGVTIPICTVNAACAEVLANGLSAWIDTGAKRRHGMLSASPNGDGTATIKATFRTYGLYISIQ